MEDCHFKRGSFQANSPELKSDKSAFEYYMEESGSNALLIQAVSALLTVPKKPENPIEWLALYFRDLAPHRKQELNSIKLEIENEIIEQESEILCMKLEETRLKERLEDIQRARNNVQATHFTSHEEDYRMYKDLPEDCRWRIKPDPSIRMTKSDILVKMFESPDNPKPLDCPDHSD